MIKYIILFVAIALAVVALLVTIVLWFIWDLPQLLKAVNKASTKDHRGDILWKETLGSTEFYFALFKIEEE